MSADEDDERQIRQLVDSWIEASKAHDLPALMDMMTDDVVFMTPSRAPFGKAEFAADVERMKGVAIDARAEVQEIEVFGPRAYVRNHVRVEITGPDAKAYVRIRDERLAQGSRRPLAHSARRQSGCARVSENSGRGDDS